MKLLHQSINRFLNQMSFTYHYEDQTEKMELGHLAGEGFVRRIVPRTDMLITVTNMIIGENKTVIFWFDKPMVELLVCLEGKGEVYVSGQYVQLRKGTMSMRLIDSVKGEYFFIGGKQINTLGIHIPVTTFNHYIQDIDGQTSTNFQQLLGQKSLLQFQQPLDMNTSQLARQMMHASYSNMTPNIFIESKALELFSLAVHHFLMDRYPVKLLPSITRTDLERLHNAQELLLSRMENPPTLMELSRMIGLNDYKLKTSFKAVYGKTVFGYLREKRLEKALQLLKSGETRVAEAAVEVGYTNASHFADAFRKQYGINPSELIRRRSTLQ